MSKTKLIIIRHGETDWNKEKRYSGFTDISINKTGKVQACKLYLKLKNEKVHNIYSSDRLRAIETGSIIFKGRAIKKVVDLREMHFGIFEGLIFEEIMQKYPEIYLRWISQPYEITIPGGEPLSDFKSRVTLAFENIAQLNKNKTTAIFSHGGAISVYLNSITESQDFWNYIPKSTGMSIVEYNNNGPSIKIFNDTAHLENG